MYIYIYDSSIYLSSVRSRVPFISFYNTGVACPLFYYLRVQYSSIALPSFRHFIVDKMSTTEWNKIVFLAEA